jgi:uncharacterized protein YkwD
MKKLFVILSILISSVVYAGGEGEYVSLKEKFMVEYIERSKTPYLYSSNKGSDTIDFRNFNEYLVEYLILKKINNHRLSNGGNILVEDTLLKDLAKGWSYTMDTSNYMYHNPELPAMECITRISNDAIKVTYNDLAEETFQIWKNSKGHNAVMLSKDEYYGSIGVSYKYKKCNYVDEFGNDYCKMFNDPGDFVMYVTFNSINGLGNLQ